MSPGGAGRSRGVEKLACCSSRRIWHGLGWSGVPRAHPVPHPRPSSPALELRGSPAMLSCVTAIAPSPRGSRQKGHKLSTLEGKRGPPLPRQGRRSRTHDPALPLVEITSTHRTQVQRRYLCASVLEVTPTAASIKITCQKGKDE